MVSYDGCDALISCDVMIGYDGYVVMICYDVWSVMNDCDGYVLIIGYDGYVVMITYDVMICYVVVFVVVIVVVRFPQGDSIFGC